MKKVTIYEVAKEANVSLATVSRVINGSDVVKTATRTKVEEAINRLGYKPNAIAQGLASSKTTTIGLIIPESAIAYNGAMINGMCDVAKIYDYNILLHTITEGITNVNEVLDEVIKSRVVGVVFYCDKSLDDSLKILEDYNIPMVVVGANAALDNVCSVYIDFKRAVKELCENYISKGITDIAILEDRKNSNITKDMVEGAKEAFGNHGLEMNNYIDIPSDSRSTYKFLSKHILENKHQLVLVNRDSQALAVLNAARENGISIPEDMELICMTDSKYNSMARPEISAFEIPSYDLGAVSVRLMTKMLKGENVEDKVKCLGYLYHARKTTKIDK